MIIIGSTALKKHGVNFREPKDFDVFVLEKEVDSLPVKCDYQIIPEEIYKSIPLVDGKYATLDAIFTVKLSHLAWDIKWDKHYYDILRLMSLGCSLIPSLFSGLYSHWENINGNKKFLSLNASKSEFFNNHVTYVYDHDYLHTLAAHPRPPVYKSVLKDNQQIMVDYLKFTALPFPKQIQMFKEEMSVIACERWMINPVMKHPLSIEQAHRLSLRKTLTRLTKGWASKFILENLYYFTKPCYTVMENILTKVKIKENVMKLTEEERYSLMTEIYGKEDITINFLDTVSGFIKIPGLVQQTPFNKHYADYGDVVFSWKGNFYQIEWSFYSDGEFRIGDIKRVVPKQKTVTLYENYEES